MTGRLARLYRESFSNLGPAGHSPQTSRISRWAVSLIVLGWGAGLASMAWLREQAVFESVHFALTSGALIGVAGAGAIGLGLQRGRALGARSAHALLGAGGLLLGLAAAVAGMAILP